METSTARSGRSMPQRWRRRSAHRRAEHGSRRPADARTTRSRLTWGELRDRVDAIAGGLAKLGVAKGDTVALMFGNRPEFDIGDLAVMTVGATPFSIYQTYSPEQIQYVVGRRRQGRADRGGRLRATSRSAQARPRDVEHVVVVDGDAR